MNFKPSSSSPEESKKREYLKQQHQLRTMNKSSVPLSADNMIQTLLSKKEIFQKRNNQSEPSIQTPQVGPWPAWLTPGREPPFYKDVWKLVGSPNGLADTNRLSTLLMTSRLTTETLGYVWSLSNVTVPGSLTQQELYINLALVALAQSGYAFANSNVICQLKEAPLPALDVHILDAVPMISSLTSPMSAPSPLINPPGMQPATSAQSLEQSLSSPVPTITESISLLDLSHEPLSLIDSSPTKSLAVLSATDLGKDFPDILPKEPNLLFSDFQTGPAGIDDDFDDFKSADIFTSEMNSLTVLDVPDPKVENMKDSPKSDSGIEDLFPRCVIKPKSPDLMQTPPDEMRPSLDLLEDLTNSRTLPALDKSVISGFQFNESSGPSSLTFPLGLNSAESSLELSELTLGAAPLQCEPRSLDLNQIQSVPPVSLKRSSISGPDTVPPLQSVDPPQEDKYSALRLLDSGLFSEERSPSQEIGEDFGDFLTADVPPRSRPSQTLKDTDDDIQIKCLEACLKLLQEAVAIFENIENPKVLDEVATNERGKTYLREILEVERIGRRIRSSRETCDQIIEFETLSKTLQPYIEYVKNIHLEEQDGPKCGICFCERGPAHVKYGINHFHAPCANLYLQLVDPILPIAPVM